MSQASSFDKQTINAKIDAEEETTPKFSRKVIWIGAAVIAFVFLALALGLGLGLGLKKHYVSYSVESYTLVRTYSGTSFFDGFDYWTAADPTNGFVKYVDRATAKSANLTYAGDSVAYMRVDDTTINTTSGRKSVRIQSTQNYTQGLFILDIDHIPYGCGVWPAFWTTDTANWPTNGEIDIVEGVNLVTENQMTLHTSQSCTMKKANRRETGEVLTNDCYTYSTDGQSSGAGCGVEATSSTTYGSGFGGGVYATDWRTEGIRIWYFPRASIPSDITNGSPTTSGWGTPLAEFPATHCDIGSHFKNHKIIFDITLCGDWAGATSTFEATCSSVTSDTCDTYVAENPSAFSTAYWAVRSVKVYQNGNDTVVGASTTVTSTTATTLSTSTTKTSHTTTTAAATTKA